MSFEVQNQPTNFKTHYQMSLVSQHSAQLRLFSWEIPHESWVSGKGLRTLDEANIDLAMPVLVYRVKNPILFFF
jgi:hypothetical protein